MPEIVQQVELTNARTQGNLKGEILDEKLAILKSIQGLKRGPQKSQPTRITMEKSYHQWMDM